MTAGARSDEHRHQPGREAPPPLGAVLLDVGGDVGALIVRVAAHLVGREMYARAGDGRLIHTGIWPRTLGSGLATLAVFPELGCGTWTLTLLGEYVGEAEIIGGTVTQLDLR
jgi:hypothetical protein